MPFTPFHMGPALAVKAAAPRYFSLPVFWVTQVAIDTEVLVGYYTGGDLSNHAVLHTFGGATLAALLIVLLLRPVLQPLFRLWNYMAGAKPNTILYMKTPVSWWVALGSVLAGGWSHALLDAMVHSSITPFAPWNDTNGFFDEVWTLTMVPLCVISGAIGGGILVWRYFRRQGDGDHKPPEAASE